MGTERSKVRIIIRGCNGKLGQVISGIAASDGEAEIVAGVATRDDGHNPYPVFQNLRDCNVEADCLIGCSVASSVDDLLDYCVERQLPCVLCTTDLSEAQQKKTAEAAKKIPVLKAANMSLGFNLLLKLLKEAANVLVSAGFDIEIVEKHHSQKVDAPSGTALALADSINEEFDNSYTYVFDRSARREKRPEKEIGISAVRGGTVIGTHDVIFAGTDEVITFSHMAYSRAIFGRGAVSAAKFLAGKPAGEYGMCDVIDGCSTAES